MTPFYQDLAVYTSIPSVFSPSFSQYNGRLPLYDSQSVVIDILLCLCKYNLLLIIEVHQNYILFLTFAFPKLNNHLGFFICLSFFVIITYS